MIDLAELADETWIARADIPTTAAECTRAGFAPRIEYRKEDFLDYQNIVSSGEAVGLTHVGCRPMLGICYVPYRDPADVVFKLHYDPATLPQQDLDALLDAVRKRAAEALAMPATPPAR